MRPLSHEHGHGMQNGSEWAVMMDRIARFQGSDCSRLVSWWCVFAGSLLNTMNMWETMRSNREKEDMPLQIHANRHIFHAETVQ